MADIPKDAPKPQVEPEAQNALTRKFTEAEWKAIKELQVRLNIIFLHILVFTIMRIVIRPHFL